MLTLSEVTANPTELRTRFHEAKASLIALGWIESEMATILEVRLHRMIDGTPDGISLEFVRFLLLQHDSALTPSTPSGAP